MRKENDTIKITEDVRIPGTDVILDAGDRIKVLKENVALDDTIRDSIVMVLRFRGGPREAGDYLAEKIMNNLVEAFAISKFDSGLNNINSFLKGLRDGLV